jgi:hypothetical protein
MSKITTIQFVSNLSDKEARQLLFEIYERVPISGEDLSYSALLDKITRYVNEAHRLAALEEAVTQYVVDECSGGNIGVQDPINFLLASHRMLVHNMHTVWKEEY